MQTKFEFRNDVGVVAGGDVRSSVGEIHLYFNDDGDAKNSQPISEEQVQKLTRKMFAVAQKSRSDSLTIALSLRTSFDLDLIEAMPRSEFPAALAYLDGWEDGAQARTHSNSRFKEPRGHRFTAMFRTARARRTLAVAGLIVSLLVIACFASVTKARACDNDFGFCVPPTPAFSLPARIIPIPFGRSDPSDFTPL